MTCPTPKHITYMHTYMHAYRAAPRGRVFVEQPAAVLSSNTLTENRTFGLLVHVSLQGSQPRLFNY